MTEKTQAEILAIIEEYNTELFEKKEILISCLTEDDKEQIEDNLLRSKVVSILDKQIAINEIKQRVWKIGSEENGKNV